MRSLLITLLCLLLAPLAARAAHGEATDYVIAQIDTKGQTFTVQLNGETKTFRVRPAIDVTINGLKATFEELEPGMKVKITSGEPGLATRLSASGLRTRTAPASTPSGPAGTPAHATLGAPAQTARLVKATIAANSPDGFPIGDVRKGTKISLQYLGGKWKDVGRIAQHVPDSTDPDFDPKNRLAIALPPVDGKPGAVLAVVPGDTAKHPFVFEADQDYPGLVLRINAPPSRNPGKVDYDVKVLPPAF
jgi:hypothetical protein